MPGLTCEGREGTACTKVVLQSRVRIQRWYDVGFAVILPRRRFRSWTSLLLSGFCFSACSCCFLFVSLVFWMLFVARRLGVEFVLCGLLFLVLAVEERFLLARWGFRRSLLFSLVHPGLRRSSRKFLYLGRFTAFFELRSAR